MEMDTITTLPPATPYAKTLNPNKLAGDYVLAHYLNCMRKEFIRVERHEITTVYNRNGIFYVVPQKDELPPAGFLWEFAVRTKARNIFRAISRVPAKTVEG